MTNDIPTAIGNPARSALEAAGITTLEQVAVADPQYLLSLHGFGPKALSILEPTLVVFKKRFILDFISQQGLMVLATTHDNGTPQAALVGFGQTERLELIFGTDNTTRKYHNLQSRKQVAVVIHSDVRTVQYEGVARELSAGELPLVREHYWSKDKSAESRHSDIRRYFIITPHWARYTNVSHSPWQKLAVDLTEG